MRARESSLRSSARSAFFVLVGSMTAVVLLLAGTGASRAQGPAPSASAAPAPAIDGGDSTYGCVESVPKGAQKPAVSDTFPQRGTSGWAATLSITVHHGKGERVLPSGLDLSSAVEAKKVLRQAGFAIPDQEGGAGAQIWTDPEDPQKSFVSTHLELPVVLLPPDPGRNAMMLPPLPVAVARANGEIATVCTHHHSILVEDPIANTPNATPKLNPDAIPQREEWTALKRALGWIALGLLVGAILTALVWRKLNEPRPEPPPPPPRPPWDVALEELDQVRHAGLLEMHRYGEYSDRTSDALRRYLGSRFGFDGLESTTDEILAALKKQGGGFIRFEKTAESSLRAFHPAPGVSFDRVASFLRECDLVKFANLTPTPEQCATSITTGEAIVRGTMPTSTPMASAEPEPPADPVAAAQLRAPFTPPPTEKRVRSPYEPPDPDEAPAAPAPEAPATTDAPPRDPPEGGST
jgi:hypothetical protein